MKPNYSQLYIDMLSCNFPEKMETMAVKKFLEGKKTTMKLIEINQFIVPQSLQNQKVQGYDKETILEILEHHVNNELTITQTAKLFNISKPTVRKWKKYFQLNAN